MSNYNNMQIDFKEDYILENEFVKLRPLELSDYEHLLEYSINQPELWKYNSGGANGEENLIKYISNTIEQRKNENEYPFIVFDKLRNKFVGSTRFYRFSQLNNTVDLGYTWYGKETHGNGINKNCKYLMLEFAFEKMDVERVGFGANNLNYRSINAMKSIGCIIEGVLRNFSLDNDGNRIDAIILSILKIEWFENIKEDLKLKIKKHSQN
ncbi:Protein N-acetyltransferase, RimJ/RimL family [Flaviramulus basaltis]|uniref:Protein N-acetyltransferase, RimJ/RimL family n=1 Tax=Flaviramulus basaltis TaxID=369401 RepID=A0A1K2I9Y5_9FLAO|nr:GNAT family N-acetyltransferase [Flaviramulus basaltis]SFZ89221.1 Protein N-acetyltransferase, RimJ/RimL family [Flaviramulus basaltis]